MTPELCVLHGGYRTHGSGFRVCSCGGRIFLIGGHTRLFCNHTLTEGDDHGLELTRLFSRRVVPQRSGGRPIGRAAILAHVSGRFCLLFFP